MAATMACLLEPVCVCGGRFRSFAMAAWSWPIGPCLPLCPLPYFVNTYHRGLPQGQSTRPDQLKLLRDVISVSPGTSSPAAMCTGVALERRGSCEILCVYACDQACERVCVRVCLIQPLGSNQLLSPSAVPWRVGAAQRLSASFHVLFLLSPHSFPFFPLSLSFLLSFI